MGKRAVGDEPRGWQREEIVEQAERLRLVLLRKETMREMLANSARYFRQLEAGDVEIAEAFEAAAQTARQRHEAARLAERKAKKK